MAAMVALSAFTLMQILPRVVTAHPRCLHNQSAVAAVMAAAALLLAWLRAVVVQEPSAQVLAAAALAVAQVVQLILLPVAISFGPLASFRPQSLLNLWVAVAAMAATRLLQVLQVPVLARALLMSV